MWSIQQIFFVGDIFNRVVVILVENNVNSAHQSWVYVDLVDNIREFFETYSQSCISSSILLKMPLSSPMMTTVLVLSPHSVCPPDTTSCLSRDAAEGVWDLEQKHKHKISPGILYIYTTNTIRERRRVQVCLPQWPRTHSAIPPKIRGRQTQTLLSSCQRCIILFNHVFLGEVALISARSHKIVRVRVISAM